MFWFWKNGAVYPLDIVRKLRYLVCLQDRGASLVFYEGGGLRKEVIGNAEIVLNWRHIRATSNIRDFWSLSMASYKHFEAGGWGWIYFKPLPSKISVSVILSRQAVLIYKDRAFTAFLFIRINSAERLLLRDILNQRAWSKRYCNFRATIR